MNIQVRYIAFIALLYFTTQIAPVLSSPLQYEIIDLGIPADPESGPWAINNAGRVAGTFETTPGSFTYHAFLWDPNDGFIDLGTLGGDLSAAHSLNDHNHVVGLSEYSAGSSDKHAFFWRDRNNNGSCDPNEMINLGALGGDYSRAYDINQSDQVVGEAEIDVDYWHPFLWQDSNGNGSSDPNEMINLGTLVNYYDYAVACAINDQAQVTGHSEDRAFLWQDLNHNGSSDPNEMIDLGDLGGIPLSRGFDINNAGNVVGESYYTDSYLTHAFFWSDANRNGLSDPNEMTDLGDLGGLVSSAGALNDANQVVGYSYTAQGPIHACLWDSDHHIIDLNDYLPADSDWVLLSKARDINNRGQIIGWGMFDNGSFLEQRAFILTPVKIKLLDPNGFEVILADTLYPVTWQSADDVKQVKIEFSPDFGQSWILIEPNIPADGSYSWRVPALDSYQCLIRISDAANLLFSDVSDNPFTVYQCPLSADLDGDCRVDLTDLNLFCTQWLQSYDGGACPFSADLIGGDCLVNLPDFAAFASQWLR